MVSFLMLTSILLRLSPRTPTTKDGSKRVTYTNKMKIRKSILIRNQLSAKRGMSLPCSEANLTNEMYKRPPKQASTTTLAY